MGQLAVTFCNYQIDLRSHGWTLETSVVSDWTNIRVPDADCEGSGWL
jgi:hypothetical protein